MKKAWALKMVLGLLLVVMLPLEAFAQTQQALVVSDEKVLAFLEQLFSIPDQKAATSAAHNQVLKERVATLIIQRFALETTGRTTGVVTSDQVRQALHLINIKMHLYADKHYGAEGKAGFEAWGAFVEKEAQNPGLRTFQKMYFQY